MVSQRWLQSNVIRNSSTIARRSPKGVDASNHHDTGTGNSSSSGRHGGADQAVLPLHYQQQQQQQQQQEAPFEGPLSTHSIPQLYATATISNSGGHPDRSNSPMGGGGSPMIPRSTSNAGLSLPQWSANPQDSFDDNASTDNNNGASSLDLNQLFYGSDKHHSHHHPYNGSSSNSGWMSNLPSCGGLLTILAVLGLISVTLYTRYSLIDSMVEVSMLMKNGQELETKLTNAEMDIRKWNRKVGAYEAILYPDGGKHNHHQPHLDGTASNSNNPKLYADQQAVEEMHMLRDRLKESEQKAGHLKEKVQMLSKREAIAKYGHQSHRVELELIFPSDLDPDASDGPTRFVIELAPLDLMPHSVHFFLEMVDSHLLDGCSFILNALHVLKAAPLPYDGSSAANKARAFTKMGLESVAFKEYAPSYPHEQYTVGFAADGSPSFYINTEDNSEIHLGDPCFGKIVEGFDTIKRLEASPTRNGIWFESRIGIKKAVILT